MEKILVTGASGQVGGATAAVLAARGIHVRAAARDPGRLRAAERIEPVAFDYKDTGTHRAALDGVSGVFLVAPPLDPDAAAKLNPFIDTAEKMGIAHVVFISALGMDASEEAPFRAVERYLIDSGPAYTVLRPSFFMENFTTGFIAPMIASGEIYLAAGDGRTGFISVRDVAEAAAAAFDRKLYGVELNLTGPRALSYAEAARIISDVSGKTVTYHAISEEAMMQGAREQGTPEGAVRYLALLFEMVRTGRMARVTSGVRDATGKDPVSFEELARRSAPYWGRAERAA